MAIKHTRAQYISDAMIEHLYNRLTVGACEECGCTDIKPAELSILLDVLRLSGVELVQPPDAAVPIRSTKKFDHPVTKPDEPKSETA